MRCVFCGEEAVSVNQFNGVESNPQTFVWGCKACGALCFVDADGLYYDMTAYFKNEQVDLVEVPAGCLFVADGVPG